MLAKAEVGALAGDQVVDAEGEDAVTVGLDVDFLAELVLLGVEYRVHLEHLNRTAPVELRRRGEGRLDAREGGADVQPVLSLRSVDDEGRRAPVVGEEGHVGVGALDGAQHPEHIVAPPAGVCRRVLVDTGALSGAGDVAGHGVDPDAVEARQTRGDVGIGAEGLVLGVADVHDEVVARRAPVVNRHTRFGHLPGSGFGAAERIPAGDGARLARVLGTLGADVERHLGVAGEVEEHLLQDALLRQAAVDAEGLQRVGFLRGDDHRAEEGVVDREDLGAVLLGVAAEGEVIALGDGLGIGAEVHEGANVGQSAGERPGLVAEFLRGAEVGGAAL